MRNVSTLKILNSNWITRWNSVIQLSTYAVNVPTWGLARGKRLGHLYPGCQQLPMWARNSKFQSPVARPICRFIRFFPQVAEITLSRHGGAPSSIPDLAGSPCGQAGQQIHRRILSECEQGKQIILCRTTPARAPKQAQMIPCDCNCGLWFEGSAKSSIDRSCCR